MKKTGLLLASLLIAFAAIGQLKTRASVDYLPGNYDVRFSKSLPPSTGYTEFHAGLSYGDFRTRIGMEYKYKRVGAYFDQHVYMQSQGFTFQPLQAEWYVGIKVYITEKINLKVEHMCTHTVLTDGSYDKQTRLYGGYNMISISYGY